MTRIRKHRLRWVHLAALSVGGFISLTVQAAPVVSGQIVDLNGTPLSQAMVTIEKGVGQPGATAVTVFSDGAGHFQFPAPGVPGGRMPTVRLLGYKTIDTVSKPAGDSLDLTVIMRPDPNESGVAPASAWLKDIADPADRTLLVQTCIGCHQIPAPEVRGYATMIHDMPNVDPVDSRQNSWHAIVQYMNAISAWEFGRGGDAPPPDPNNVYSGGPLVATTALLARTMLGSFREVTGYHYGAPVLANAHTVIREYEVPRPNAVREALTLDDPPRSGWPMSVPTE